MLYVARGAPLILKTLPLLLLHGSSPLQNGAVRRSCLGERHFGKSPPLCLRCRHRRPIQARLKDGPRVRRGMAKVLQAFRRTLPDICSVRPHLTRFTWRNVGAAAPSVRTGAAQHFAGRLVPASKIAGRIPQRPGAQGVELSPRDGRQVRHGRARSLFDGTRFRRAGSQRGRMRGCALERRRGRQHIQLVRFMLHALCIGACRVDVRLGLGLARWCSCSGGGGGRKCKAPKLP
mmetsp:Transcript_39933/g.106725  ORF Transcript_39933/g.106725 Transcript_39933/m.106725 type:complete len:233 (-) Transcript_39933:514-1212(-)